MFEQSSLLLMLFELMCLNVCVLLMECFVYISLFSGDQSGRLGRHHVYGARCSLFLELGLFCIAYSGK